MNYIDYLSAAFSSHFFAGAAGAFVRAITARTNNIYETMVGGLAGALSANFLTPAVSHYLEITNSNTSNTVAFLIGLLGVYGAESLMRLAARYAANPSIPTSFTPAGLVDAISQNPISTKPIDDDADKPKG